MEETNSNTRSSAGFSFGSQKDAELAELERKKIEYLETKLDYSKPETILKVYDKAIHERIFKTPVGIVFLKKLQDFLYADETIDSQLIADIPLFHNYDDELRERANPARTRVKPAPAKKDKKNVLHLSIVLNILLVCAIVAMFAITLNAEQPNILNYKTVITNQYSEWEQELKDREAAVREKEKELLINEYADNVED